jgi:hypothetical protein
MASRPVFVPIQSRSSMVREIPVDFKWHAGLSTSQKQKSVEELHSAARVQLGINRVLEVSTKSKEELGRALSAFNLGTHLPGGSGTSVEVAYQASKKFEHGGPYLDLLSGDSRAAKTDERLRNSGRLLAFSFGGAEWPLEPPTAFYDWLYVSALSDDPKLANDVLDWEAFTDIEFNPKRSLNCQARSVALYCSMVRSGSFEQLMSSPHKFRKAFSMAYRA